MLLQDFIDEQWRGLVTFDVSAIPDDATINSAVVSVYGRDQINELGSIWLFTHRCKSLK